MLFSITGLFAQYTYDVTGPFPVSNGSFNLSTNTSTAGFTDWHADDAGGTGNTWSAAYTIPFAFDYFGTPVTQFVVSKNYLLSFDTSLAGTTVKASLNNNSALPDTAVHDNTIAYYWDNFGNPAPLGTNDHVWIGVFGTAPNRQLWVRNWSYETEGRSFSYNNVVFEETTNKIYMTESYCSSAGVGSMTLGVQLNGSVAVQAPGSPALTSTTTNSAWASVTYWDFTPKLLVNDDASAISIDAPTNPITVGNQAVSATIANPGLNTLNTATVNWSVNGVTQTPVSLPAPLASNASASVSLGMFNFTGITTVDVWTSSPNGTVDANPANDTISETFYLGLSGTYTVDGSQASSATNFQSFADLENALTLGGLAGPVTVNVAPGTYTDPLLLSNIVGADSINNLLIDGGSSATTIMDGTGNFYTIAFEDMEFVTVQNMGIVNNGTTAMAVIFGPNSSNNTVKNCEIKVSTTSTSSLVNPIGSSNSLTTRSTNANGVDNNVVEDNRIVGGYYGVYFDGGSGNLQFGNQVLNNQIDSVYYYGVYGYYQDQMTVIGNTADVALRGNVNGDGIYGLYNTNGTFTDNYMHAIDYGFYISNSSTLAGPTYQKTLIANNMIISDTDYGMYLNSLDQVNLFHNSITAGGTSTPALQIQGSSTYPISRYDMRNNILASMNTEALEIVTVPDTFFTKCDNNAYYTTGATLIRANNTNYADLTAYKAVATTYNLASIEGDPQFLSATDLHIIGAFVNDLGDNSVGITTDIDGDTRPFPGATTVDIGADEFAPALCPPVANLSAGNATLTSADIYWDGTIGNTWQYEVTLAGLGQGTGTLAISATDSVTIAGLTSSTAYEYFVREICGRGDTSLWLGPLVFNTSNGVPYAEDFETWAAGNTGTSFPSGWNSTTTSAPRWESEDATGSNENSTSTGPFYDNTNFGTPGGLYMYLETSGAPVGNIAELISAPIYLDTSMTAVTLEFAYHMYGSAMGDLNVYVDDNGARTLITTLSGQTQTAGGDAWILSKNVIGGMNGKSIQLVFAGVAGTGYQSDMSIDDVRLFVPAAQDGGVTDILAPGSGCGLGSADTVTVEITNFGTAALSNFPVAYVLNGGTPVTGTFTGTIASGATANYTFPTTVNLATPGTYNLMAYTMIAGDGDVTNDTSSSVINSIPVLSSFPYVEGFESGNGGWTAGGTSSSWALGAPTGTVINSAAGGTNSWVTNLTGQYNGNEQSFVQGPCFDFTSIAAPQFKADIWWNSEFSWDGAALQSSVDGGTTWQNVGAFGDPNNWYNDNTINGFTGNQDGWTGTNTSSNGSGGWVLAEHDLTGLGGVSGVLLRIRFGADGSGQDDGFAFDNIVVQDAPAADAGIAEIVRPVNGCGLGSADSVEIRVINAGGAPIFNFPVNYELNGGTAVTETYTDTIFPGDTGNFIFNTTVNVAVPATYSIVTYSSLAADGNNLNDTLAGSFVHIPILSSFPYTEGFESGNGGWTAGGVSSSWALGTPAGTTINSAAGGVNSWITSLAGQYNANEQSFVQGPCFDFTSLSAPQFKAEIWWNSEFSWDGAALQSSVDGGATWQHVGAFGDPNNWYNDNTINGFTGNQEGWTGRNSTSNGSGGWVLAEHDLNGLGGVPAVLLRIAFGADGSGQDDGFAFDNIVVQEAPASDIGIVSLDAPGSGCGLGAADTVKISVANFGSATAMNFPVSFVFNGGTAVTETFTDSIQPGDTAQYTFTTATVNVSMFNTTYTFDAYSALAGDGNVLNDTLSGVQVVNNTQAFPYSENFDALASGQSTPFANGWVAYATGGNLPWQSRIGGTPSTATGPLNDNTTGTGTYMFTETSGATANAEGFIESPCIDLTTNTTGNLRLSYYYHMFGTDVGTLAAEIDSAGTWVLVDTINGQQQLAQADPFFRAIIDLSAYAGLSGTKVRFSHINYPGGYRGDIAIDDVVLDDSTTIGIDVVRSAEAFSLYPNPSNGEFTLSFTAEQAGTMNVNVKDINGKLVYQNAFGVNGSFRNTFDFTSFSKGVYFMEIQTGNATRVEKLIIQ